MSRLYSPTIRSVLRSIVYASHPEPSECTNADTLAHYVVASLSRQLHRSASCWTRRSRNPAWRPCPPARTRRSGAACKATPVSQIPSPTRWSLPYSSLHHLHCYSRTPDALPARPLLWPWARPSTPPCGVCTAASRGTCLQLCRFSPPEGRTERAWPWTEVGSMMTCQWCRGSFSGRRDRLRDVFSRGQAVQHFLVSTKKII